MLGRESRPHRSGLTLLEVLAALVILGIGAVSWATLFGQNMHAVRMAHARDAEAQRATALLARVSLWSRSELAARVGRTGASGFLLVVGEITPSLYDVAIADTLRGAELLRTSFYVRDSSALAQR